MKDIKCACGCGQTIPWWLAEQGQKYINSKHLIAKQRRDAFEAAERKWFQKEDQVRNYCSSYNSTKVQCVKCYSNLDGMYRGCYEKPNPFKN